MLCTSNFALYDINVHRYVIKFEELVIFRGALKCYEGSFFEAFLYPWLRTKGNHKFDS